MLRIIVNGEERDVAVKSTISELLDSLQLTGKPVVVELNQRALFAREHATTSIPAGARIEIVLLAAGG